MPRENEPGLPFLPTGQERKLIEEASRLQANLDRLFAAIGDGARCGGCNAPIVWVTHKNQRKAPYDRDGVNHFITCPQRDHFRRGPNAKATKSETGCR